MVALAAETEITGPQLLPDFNLQAYSAGHTDRAADPKDSKSYSLYGKTFKLGWMTDRGPQNLYFALSMPDGTHMVFDTGLNRHRNANASTMHGACQFLTTGSSRQEDRAILLSELDATATPHKIEIFALTGLSYNDERKIYEQICKYAPSHPSIRTIIPNAAPFAAIDLNP